MTAIPFRAPLARVLAIAVLAVALPACSLLGGKKAQPTQFAPQPRVQADPSWPSVGWQLGIGSIQVARPYDTQRIAVRPTPDELQVYKTGTWVQRPAEMLESTLLRVLEDSGKVRAAARTGSGVNADYRLLLDIRRFEADYAGGAVPQATIEVSAKLLNTRDADVVATRTFLLAHPATGTALPQVVDAFEQALGRTAMDIAGWTLTSGASNGRPAPAGARR